jgi:hypothetical protein
MLGGGCAAARIGAQMAASVSPLGSLKMASATYKQMMASPAAAAKALRDLR